MKLKIPGRKLEGQGAEAGLFLPHCRGSSHTAHHVGPGLAPQAEESVVSIQDAKNPRGPTVSGTRSSSGDTQ